MRIFVNIESVFIGLPPFFEIPLPCPFSIRNTATMKSVGFPLDKPAMAKCLVVVHTVRELVSGGIIIRIISARRATRREKLQFKED